MPKPTEKPYFAIGEPQNAEGRPTHEEIETRAYQLYLERGRTDGQQVEDWLHAEQELLAKRAKQDRIAKVAAA
jgi:Protein of unknown function (DUF2934)